MNEDEDGGPFNVAIWFADGFWEYFLQDVPAKRAVEAAKRCVDNADSLLGRGLVVRVAVTDKGDYTNFLWERGKGIVYPPPEELERHARSE